ncbi:hypothetical protein C0J52_11504 [Blattella germanica]|nr:hypothetical protein C0J52_11504 [Blattella germanica]
MSNPTEANSKPEALRKLAQLQIERLKKEEEEEQWISGEELYTEGSSDEDDSALRAKKRTDGRARKHRRATPGKEARRKQGHQKSVSPQPPTTSTESVSKSGMSPPELKLEESAVVEEQIEISWRPKRGSIKLPNLGSEGRELLATSDVASH